MEFFDQTGNWWGRPPTGRDSKYLLSGLARCECCGATLSVHGYMSGSPKRRKRSFRYVCGYHHNRGSTVCDNGMRIQMADFDTQVIDAIERTVLTPEVVTATIRAAVKQAKAQRDRQPNLPGKIKAEIKKLKR